MSKFKSIIKKAGSVIKSGLEPYELGKQNFEDPILCVEEKAKKRLEVCMSCNFFVDEPIEFLRVKDSNIPELSNKMCNDCGCVLSYKIRQDLKKCKKWQKQKQS